MKGNEFVGTSLKMVREFPALAKREAGHQLERVQHGMDSTDWKPKTSKQDLDAAKRALKKY